MSDKKDPSINDILGSIREIIDNDPDSVDKKSNASERQESSEYYVPELSSIQPERPNTRFGFLVVLMLIGFGAFGFYVLEVQNKTIDLGLSESIHNKTIQRAQPQRVENPFINDIRVDGTVKPTIAFYEIPKVIADVKLEDDTVRQLILLVSLEIPVEYSEVANKLRIEIMNSFQNRISGMPINDLRGSPGVYSLKNKLIEDANDVFGREVVKDIIFREMIVR